MSRLRQLGPVVFIDTPLPVLMERVDDEDQRGIARAPGQDLRDVFAERQPLYQRYAEITVASEQQSAEMTARLLARQLTDTRA